MPFLLLALWGTWMLIQLVPLPPGIWQALPGRERYVEAAAAAGIAQPWRPISLTPDLTWNSLLALLPAAVALTGIAAIRRERSHSLVYILIGCSCASSLLGILQLQGRAESSLFLYDVTHANSAVGFFANRNHQAALLAITFPLLRLWTLMPQRDSQRQRTCFWIATGIGIFLLPMLLVTGSRAGLGLGLVGILGALLLAPGERKPAELRRKLRFQAILPVIALLAVTVATLMFGRAVAVQRLISLNVSEDELRFSKMPTVVEIVKEFFTFGSGFGSFDPVFRNFEPDAYLNARFFNHAHNEVLEIAMTGGVPALVILAVFLIWSLRRGVAAFVPYRSTALDVLFARAGAVIILILSLASLVDYPLRTPLMGFVFAIAVAWLARSGSGQEGHGRAAGTARTASF